MQTIFIMGDYDKKVQPPGEHDPYEHLSLNPIEKDKKDKEEYPKHFHEETSKSQIFATLISYFKKMIAFFGSKEEEDLVTFEKHRVFEHLVSFRTQLRCLTEQDESYNPEFTQQLTELWHNLTDDCNSVSVPLKISSKTTNNIKFLLSQISSYPPGSDHTLGYYFDAYAGTDWNPFPFMDLLKELYQEHQENPSSSHLSKWLYLLDEIISSIKV